jgi:hypothetical protein
VHFGPNTFTELKRGTGVDDLYQENALGAYYDNGSPAVASQIGDSRLEFVVDGST